MLFYLIFPRSRQSLPTSCFSIPSEETADPSHNRGHPSVNRCMIRDGLERWTCRPLGGDVDGDRDDRIGKDGRQHDDAPARERTPRGGLRPEGGGDSGRRGGGSDRGPHPGRSCGKTVRPACRLGDGPLRETDRRHHRGTGRPPVSRGHRHRRGEQQLQGHDASRRGAQGKGAAVRRCRDQRRRVGGVRGVQHDGRGGGGHRGRGCGRSSKRWLPRPTRGGGASGRAGPGTSSRWSTTGSNTA